MTINVGIIGLGKMGILHSGIVSSMPNARIKAVCEHERVLRRIGRALLPKSVSIYDDHFEMIEREEIDAAYITTPISTHASLVRDITRADDEVSLFVEKPLALSFREARMACRAFNDLPGTNMVGYQKRASPVFRKAREAIGGGSLGGLRFFRAFSYSSDGVHRGKSWRFEKGSGGVLLDLAPHLLDLILWFFGMPKSVRSNTRGFSSSKGIDYVHVVMTYPSGIVGNLDICWGMRDFRLPEVSVEVYGEKGTLLVNDDYMKLRHYGTDIITPSQTFYRQDLRPSVSFQLADPEYTDENESFLRAVASGRKAFPDFEEASKVNALIDMIRKSI